LWVLGVAWWVWKYAIFVPIKLFRKTGINRTLFLSGGAFVPDALLDCLSPFLSEVIL
jgi:hypothetical protein